MSALADAVDAALTFPFVPIPEDVLDDELFDIADIEHVVAIEYLRVSKDRHGDLKSNREQHLDDVVICERRRWTLAGTYSDEGSASNIGARAKKRRADFDRLVDDLKAGTFAAHLLILWEASRGSRDLGEWHAFIKLLEKRGVLVFVVNARRVFNPRLPDDWSDLMDLVREAEKEVRKSQQRIKRSTKNDAKVGAFGGGRRPFGWDKTGIVEVPHEIELLHEAVRRVIGRDSVRSICADWNERGERTSYGNDWHPRALTTILRSERLAGLRVHRGRVVGAASWQPIVDEAQRRRLLAALDARTSTATRGRTPWVLTGSLECAVCHQSMSSWQDSRGVKRYRCRKAPGYKGCGAVTIVAAGLEDHIGTLLTSRMANVEARRAAGQLDDDDSSEQAELNRIAAERIEIADAKALGKISKETAREEAAALDRLQADVNARIAAKSALRPAALDFVLDDDMRGKSWPELTVTQQRRLLAIYVKRVAVSRSTSIGSPRFDDSRVDIDWLI